MRRPVISVEGLSKQYIISAASAQYGTLADSLSQSVQNGLGRLLGKQGPGSKSFWALRDVSFTVQPGEVVGIIGRNGAGKSTLLKVLSRITEPTTGRVRVRGRMASLLEVGTGFHAELSGRENVYLNGAILGMSRREIGRKFDEIVSFAEVEQFIDTPVKRYSSGMYLRLAFAVAAHLDPEILVVDEVLAVGDQSFQNKCLGRMREVASAGRAVLLVSHNMSAIQALCSRGVLLRRGKLAFDGDAPSAVREYLGYLDEIGRDPFGDNPERSGSGAVRLRDARLLDDQGAAICSAIAGEPVTLELEYESNTPSEVISVGLTIYNHLGIAATHLNTAVVGAPAIRAGNDGLIRCRIPALPLTLGEYRVAAALYAGNTLADQLPTILTFEVAGSTFYRTGRTPPIDYSTCLFEHEWQHGDLLPSPCTFGLRSNSSCP